MIQKATPAQIEEIIRSYAQQAMHEEAIYLNPLIEQERIEQMIASVLERGGCYFTAVEQDQLAGYVLFGTSRDFFTEETVGFIYELYVLPAYRHKGYGKQLLQAAHQQLRESGLKEVRLNVFMGNPAERLYQSLGYQDRSKIMSLPL